MITFILDSLMNCVEKAEKNLFRDMEHSDMVIENLKEKAIIFVGEQNVGKSTLVDLVTNSPMIGKGQGENACYVSMSAQEEEIGTEDSNRYRPPVNNIKQYSRDVSCIDLGSWKEDGDYVDSIGFTYFLHKVLQKVREVKFVLVIEQSSIADKTGKKIMRPFIELLNMMFKIERITPKIMKQLKNSLSMVVTKLTKHNYKNDLKDILSNLYEGQQLQVDNRGLIIQLIESVLLSNRVKGFKLAKDNRSPKEKERKLLDYFTTSLKWSYFNLKKAECSIKQSIISFSKQVYEAMSERNQNSFYQLMEQKVNSYKQEIRQIFRIPVNDFPKDWNKAIDSWQKTGELVISNCYQNEWLFAKIHRFLLKYDVYNRSKTVTTNFRSNYNPPSLISTVNTILNGLKEIDCHFINQNTGFKQQMQQTAIVYSRLMNIFMPFCSYKDHEILLTRLDYVFQRSFTQCINLYHLRDVLIHRAKYYPIDAIQNAFQIRPNTYLQDIFKRMNPDLMSLTISSIDDLNQYQQLLAYCQNYYSFQKYQEDIFFFPQHKCDILEIKTELLLKAGNKKQALKCLIKFGKALVEIINLLIDNNEYTPIEYLQMKALKTIKIMKQFSKAEIVEPQPSDPELCKHLNFAKSACEVHWSLLNQILLILEKNPFYEIEDFARLEEVLNFIVQFEEKKEQYRQEVRTGLNLRQNKSQIISPLCPNPEQIGQENRVSK